MSAHPRYATYLSEYIHATSGYLDHAKSAERLIGLRAVTKAVDKLITKEYATARPTPAAQPMSHITRFMAHIRRKA